MLYNRKNIAQRFASLTELSSLETNIDILTSFVLEIFGGWYKNWFSGEIYGNKFHFIFAKFDD